MKPSRIQEVLTGLLAIRWPVFLWGPPGVGKSSIVRAIAKERKLALIDIRASLLDPTDLRGLPAVTGGKAVWYPPSFLPQDPASSGLLFFDELNAAPPLVQASLYQLTLDRKVGEYVLPDGWHIVAAGNRAEDSSIVFRMPAALSNRFVHLDFEVDAEDWRSWALKAGIHLLVMSFLAVRPALLFDMKGSLRAFPTPRSWEMLSAALKQFGQAADFVDLAKGIVGEGPAMEFAGFCRRALNEEQILAIVDDPRGAELPEDLGELYTLVTYLSSWAAKKEVEVAAALLLDRLNPELAVLLARDMIQGSPAFIRQSGYKAFIAKHRDFLL